VPAARRRAPTATTAAAGRATAMTTRFYFSCGARFEKTPPTPHPVVTIRLADLPGGGANNAFIIVLGQHKTRYRAGKLTRRREISRRAAVQRRLPYPLPLIGGRGEAAGVTEPWAIRPSLRSEFSPQIGCFG
jgi:hypothetical protein